MTTPSGRILLVEDNQDDIDLTLRAFKRRNFLNEIHVARDGVEALEFLFGTTAGGAGAGLPLLTILDLNLPRIPGMEVLRRIRADERTRLMPVVILTTSREEQEVIEGYRLGANAYVQKPVSFDAFTEAAGYLGMFWLMLNVPPGS